MLSDANATWTDEEPAATLNSFMLFFGDQAPIPIFLTWRTCFVGASALSRRAAYDLRVLSFIRFDQ
jgi:hypothetical protein